MLGLEELLLRVGHTVLCHAILRELGEVDLPVFLDLGMIELLLFAALRSDPVPEHVAFSAISQVEQRLICAVGPTKSCSNGKADRCSAIRTTKIYSVELRAEKK